MSHNLKEGALLVADSHYSPKNPHFLTLLEKIYSGEIKTSQLILLGDNFDLLLSPVKSSIDNNRKAIDLINKISEEKEIVYFEGNHDFLLKKIFKKAKIFSYFQQPVLFQLNEQRVLFSHGDWGNNTKHSVMTNLFRNVISIQLFNFLSFNFINNWFVTKLTNRLQTKNICTKIKNFQEIIQQRLLNKEFDCDYIVEGHFHQGEEFLIKNQKYINVNSFACNQSYLVVEYSQNTISFIKKTL